MTVEKAPEVVPVEAIVEVSAEQATPEASKEVSASIVEEASAEASVFDGPAAKVIVSELKASAAWKERTARLEAAGQGDSVEFTNGMLRSATVSAVSAGSATPLAEFRARLEAIGGGATPVGVEVAEELVVAPYDEAQVPEIAKQNKDLRRLARPQKHLQTSRRHGKRDDQAQDDQASPAGLAVREIDGRGH
ncbi:MAG: hypothetical protein ACI9MR_004094 [Myxococcota bacterium]